MLYRVGKDHLSFPALVRIDDAARTLARALFVAERHHRDDLSIYLPSLEDLQVGLLFALRKWRAADDQTFDSYPQELMFLEVIREATSWSLLLRAPDVAIEVDSLRAAIVRDDVAFGHDAETLAQFLDEVILIHRL